MNFNGSGGLMFLIIAGLWLWVFIPSWFKRSQERQVAKPISRELRQQAQGAQSTGGRSPISNLAERNIRLSMTNKIFSTIALFSLATSIASIFLAVSQIFYWIVTFIFSVVFVTSWTIARAAKRKNLDVLAAASKRRSNVYASVANSLRYQDAESSIAGIPVDTRAWEANRLPAPRQRIGELELPTLAEVVEIEERVIKKSQATLDSTALDEILRRRRANG
ncbi:MAG: hypothetical protein RL351_457 [Actinomycetota bacterium]|jgi:hypothetical protein